MPALYPLMYKNTREVLQFQRTSVTIQLTLPKTVTDESLNNVTEATINLIDIVLSGMCQTFCLERRTFTHVFVEAKKNIL